MVKIEFRKKDGVLHCEDGPAIINNDGSKEWYIDGERHREDGPAIEFTNGYGSYYIHGQRHREDGPAVEYGTYIKYYWRGGCCENEKEWFDKGYLTEEEKLLLTLKYK